MKQLISFGALLLALGFSGALSAQEPGADRGVREFNFDEDVLTVDYLKPDLEFVAMVEQERMASLIQVRKDFTDEIIKAAEEIY